MKLISRFDRIMLLSITGLLMILGGTWLAWTYSAPPPIQRQSITGVKGPISIEFPMAMDSARVTKYIQFDPLLVGSVTWSGNTLNFWPIEPFKIGQKIVVKINPGSRTVDGREIRQAVEWQVQVREPRVVYMAPSQTPEIWKVNSDGTQPQRLTDTAGQIFDYDVIPGGEAIVFSMYDETGGISLWKVDSSGGKHTRLLDCGRDWCNNPSVSPDGQSLAYARRQAGLTPGSEPGIPRIWILNLNSGGTRRLYPNPEIGGFSPIWSPDSLYLAFFDGISKNFRLVNIKTNHETLLPAELGMTGQWSPDGFSFYFTNRVEEQNTGYESVFRYALPDQKLTRWENKYSKPADYGPVAFSPDGKWLAVGKRDIDVSHVRQLWLMQIDGSQPTVITSQLGLNVGNYSWNPDGSGVLFEGLDIEKTTSPLSVAYWSRSLNRYQILAEDAALPKWLP